MIKASIIIPVYNEEKYIKNCIESIINSNLEGTQIEVLLIDGGSTDNTVSIIKKYQKNYPFIQLLKNPKKIAPVAMNIGIKHSKGDFIFIISAHAKYSENYFIDLIKFCKKLNAHCVGPVLITEVKNKDKISIAIKNVLSDRFGVGSAFRSGIKKIKEVDTVPFGCYKREVFEKIGYFDERLVRNQDIEFNKRLKNSGGKIYIIPEIKCTYFARENFKDLAKNNFENGKWNILTAYYTKNLKSLSIRHFIPLIFIFSLILPLFICPQMSFVILTIYFTIITLRSLKIKKETTLLYQILSFLILHFSYGLGELAGIGELIFKNFYKKYGKRIFDLLMSFIGLIITSPVFLITGLILKIFDKGPVFFKQIRIGKNGKPFLLYKFRTMKQNIEKNNSTITTKNDPRITEIGKFLRKTKIDELPQLINVLKGDMSFVGPRPDVPGYADKLTGEDKIILSVKPGITGPAQLKYKNEEELLAKVDNPVKYNDEVLWPDKVKINREYVKNISFLKDIKYIIKTIFG